MWQFFVFWWHSLCKAILSAWSLAGGIDLMLAITGIWLQNWAKTRGPYWLRQRAARVAKRHILAAAFLIWLVPAMLWAPYAQFKEEHEKRVAAERASPGQAEIKGLREELAPLQSRANEENAREWPSLTSRQITEWADALRPYHIPEIYLFWDQITDARKLFKSLKAVSKQADIREFGSGIGGSDIPKEVLISTPKNHPAGPILERLFKTLDCTVKLQDDRGEVSKEILIYLGERQ